MDYREKEFKNKFNAAARLLGVKPNEISSLKLRENINSYSEYHELIQFAEHEIGIQCQDVDGAFHGNGHLINHENNKIIIVEHETGLEILYISGSIASLIGLIPLVLQGWRAINRHRGGRNHMDHEDVEIRRLDSSGHLIEEHIHDRNGINAISMMIFNSALLSTANLLEREMKHINEQIQSLTSRVDSLEKSKTTKKKSAK
jgi:hypothetical protein